MDNINAIQMGALANKPQFFGTAAAETISAVVTNGSWNSDRATAATSSASWIARSGQSNYSAGSGSFALHSYGVINNYLGHRTILLGY